MALSLLAPIASRMELPSAELRSLLENQDRDAETGRINCVV